MAVIGLEYRRIDVERDGDFAFANYRQACIASFGSAKSCSSKTEYIARLTGAILEYPEGHVMAFLKDHFVGQVEVQVPYGLRTGYINLFYIAPEWRRLGIGRQMHQFVDRYLQSWEAAAVELHVSPTNLAAVGFYRSLGYRTLNSGGGDKLRLMRRELVVFESRARSKPVPIYSTSQPAYFVSCS